MLNIDDVYRKVQSVANKDQRSSIKPEVFNNFVGMVLYDIIEDSRAIITDTKALILKGVSELERVDYVSGS